MEDWNILISNIDHADDSHSARCLPNLPFLLVELVFPLLDTNRNKRLPKNLKHISLSTALSSQGCYFFRNLNNGFEIIGVNTPERIASVIPLVATMVSSAGKSCSMSIFKKFAYGSR
jgi:hypothetical protein